MGFGICRFGGLWFLGLGGTGVGRGLPLFAAENDYGNKYP